MKRIFWLFFFLGAYLWTITSGHDEFFLEQGKAIYQRLVHWFDDADVDFQVHATKPIPRKKERRWG
ncbi:MAG TPA: hypothetical protein VGM34_00150 [Chlamydiales bacterium]|jgi:hypothetical protein